MLIEVAQIPRSTFYYQLSKLNHEDKDSNTKEMITNIYHEHKGRYGYRRITQEIRNQGITINHKKVQRLMRALGLKSMIRIKKYKSYRGDVGKIAQNLLNRNFKATKPNQKWATDITEFALFGRKIYLSTIIDLYNGEIVCYNVKGGATYPLVGDMIKQAEPLMKENPGLILHSDQGWHYQMFEYRKALKDCQTVQSMSRKGNCLDNAVQENFFGLLKSELVKLENFRNLENFIDELHDYIWYYNHKRIKSKLKMSPVQYRTHFDLVA